MKMLQFRSGKLCVELDITLCIACKVEDVKSYQLPIMACNACIAALYTSRIESKLDGDN